MVIPIVHNPGIIGGPLSARTPGRFGGPNSPERKHRQKRVFLVINNRIKELLLTREAIHQRLVRVKDHCHHSVRGTIRHLDPPGLALSLIWKGRHIMFHNREASGPAPVERVSTVRVFHYRGILIDEGSTAPLACNMCCLESKIHILEAGRSGLVMIWNWHLYHILCITFYGHLSSVTYRLDALDVALSIEYNFAFRQADIIVRKIRGSECERVAFLKMNVITFAFSKERKRESRKHLKAVRRLPRLRDE